MKDRFCIHQQHSHLKPTGFYLMQQKPKVLAPHDLSRWEPGVTVVSAMTLFGSVSRQNAQGSGTAEQLATASGSALLVPSWIPSHWEAVFAANKLDVKEGNRFNSFGKLES